MQSQVHEQVQTRVQMQSPSVLDLRTQCTFTVESVQVPAPRKGASCRNGNKDPMHRARRAPRPPMLRDPSGNNKRE